jgi:CheY-like chemotaxis protein
LAPVAAPGARRRKHLGNCQTGRIEQGDGAAQEANAMDGDKSVRGRDLHSPVGQEGLADTGRPGADIKPAEDKDTHLVLIVDDDASFVEAAAVFLGSHGYQTAKTYSGMQAVSEVRERPVDVAIIDLYLPDISGVLVARALRRLRPAAVVIMISGDDSDGMLPTAAPVPDDPVTQLVVRTRRASNPPLAGLVGNVHLGHLEPTLRRDDQSDTDFVDDDLLEAPDPQATHGWIGKIVFPGQLEQAGSELHGVAASRNERPDFRFLTLGIAEADEPDGHFGLVRHDVADRDFQGGSHRSADQNPLGEDQLLFRGRVVGRPGLAVKIQRQSAQSGSVADVQGVDAPIALLVVALI